MRPQDERLSLLRVDSSRCRAVKGRQGWLLSTLACTIYFNISRSHTWNDGSSSLGGGVRPKANSQLKSSWLGVIVRGMPISCIKKVSVGTLHVFTHTDAHLSQRRNEKNGSGGGGLMLRGPFLPRACLLGASLPSPSPSPAPLVIYVNVNAYFASSRYLHLSTLSPCHCATLPPSTSMSVSSEGPISQLVVSLVM